MARKQPAAVPYPSPITRELVKAAIAELAAEAKALTPGGEYPPLFYREYVRGLPVRGQKSPDDIDIRNIVLAALQRHSDDYVSLLRAERALSEGRFRTHQVWSEHAQWEIQIT